jgi:hypothetical protein
VLKRRTITPRTAQAIRTEDRCPGRYAAIQAKISDRLELNISILSAALRNEPTGQPHDFRGDVAAVAKRDLRAGEMLDGEGGYTV